MLIHAYTVKGDRSRHGFEAFSMTRRLREKRFELSPNSIIVACPFPPKPSNGVWGTLQCPRHELHHLSTEPFVAQA